MGSHQEAHKAASNRAPPIWVWLALFALGFNEMMAVLYNPLWLLLGILLILFGKTVYQVPCPPLASHFGASAMRAPSSPSLLMCALLRT